MARNFEAKNIIVGAATFYVGQSGVENTKINVSTSTDTAQDPTKIAPAAGASWYHLGYTQNGVTMNIEPTYGEVVVDQLLDIAKMFKSGQRVTVATSLTETTLENLYVSIGSKTGTSGDLRIQSPLNNDRIASDLLVRDGFTALDIAGFSSSAHATYGDGSSSNVAGSAVAVLDINGGALGYEPIERSVCFVGPGPSKLASGTQKAERIYIGYRAVSMDPVGMAVQRDNVTLFPVNFRLMPSETNTAQDGNAAYGKIVDRVY